MIKLHPTNEQEVSTHPYEGGVDFGRHGFTLFDKTWRFQLSHAMETKSTDGMRISV